MSLLHEDAVNWEGREQQLLCWKTATKSLKYLFPQMVVDNGHIVQAGGVPVFCALVLELDCHGLGKTPPNQQKGLKVVSALV